MKPFIYIGVDPGVTGAIAFYRPSTGSLVVYDMPTRPQGETGRREVCPNTLAAYVGRFSSFPSIAVIEKVGAMTGKEGRSSMFQFGRSFGIVLGVLASHKIGAIETRPAVWKSMMVLGSNKDESLMLARYTFPRHRKQFLLKKNHGRAEAALLAFLGDRIWKR